MADPILPPAPMMAIVCFVIGITIVQFAVNLFVTANLTKGKGAAIDICQEKALIYIKNTLAGTLWLLIMVGAAYLFCVSPVGAAGPNLHSSNDINSTAI